MRKEKMNGAGQDASIIAKKMYVKDVQATLLAIASLLAVIDSPCYAVSSPLFEVTVQSDTIIRSITRADVGGGTNKAHLNFPYLKLHANGDLVVNYQTGQTQSGNAVNQQMISTDNGQTWTPRALKAGDRASAQLIRTVGEESRAFSIGWQAPSFTSWSNTRFVSTNGGTNWQNDTNVAFDTGTEAYDLMAQTFSDLREIDGSIYGLAYARRPGASKFESVLFVSDDDGESFSRRSTVATYTSSLNNGLMGSEGPNEASLIGLDNGNLLAVYRTGQPFPSTDINATDPSIFFSISSDSGFSWTAPKSLGVGGAFPLLNKLSDGSVAMTYGRYGVQMMFADEAGTRWSFPTTLYDGPTSGYVEMRNIGSDQFVLVYDQSGFYPPSANPGPTGYVYDNDDSANLRALRMSLQRLPDVDAFNWDLAYQGDVAPVSSGQPWVETRIGGVSLRLPADQGQDFLRYETLGGSTNQLFYTLSGSAQESAWDGVDFAQGFVMEVRTRVGDPTAPSAASIAMDDGSNGFISLELTGSYVGLEGLGGNGGQVNYDATDDPSFSPLDWNEYRLVIAPDVDQNGMIIASLFLNGDFSTPILTQSLDPSILNDQIRFGDLTGANNGVFDVDYLRFASTVEPLPGDFNEDGFVDGDDLTAWESGYGVPSGASPMDGDADGDFDVDGNDFLIWQQQFGMTNNLSAATTAVPEPSSFMLALLAAALLARYTALRQPFPSDFCMPQGRKHH